MPSQAKPLHERFWPKVEWSEGCWLWTGATAKGYGKFFVGRTPEGRDRLSPAPRVAYELAVGPIPEGMQIDHLCRTPLCVRPDHLEPVTPRLNSLRGRSLSAERARRTHCPAGHRLTPDNTFLSKRRQRSCRECRRLRQRTSERLAKAA
jgi:hypothetical protein